MTRAATAAPRVPDDHFDGKRVVLTGGSEGIGREAALQLARAGAQVVICARNSTRLAEVAAAAAASVGHGEVLPLTADLGSADGVDAFWTAAVMALGGPPDVLILNHVTGFYGEVLTTAPGSKIRPLLERLLRVNTLAYAQLAMLALETDRASPGPGGGSESLPVAAGPPAAGTGVAIVVVSSAAGKLGLPRVAPYAASKHALHGFFDSLRHDLVRTEARGTISLVVLGNIDTASNRAATAGQLSNAVKRHPVADAAQAVVRAAATRPREVSFPALEIAPLAVLHAVLPATVDTLVAWIVEP